MILSLTLCFLHHTFYNLSFTNNVLINSRTLHLSGNSTTIALLKPLYYTLVCALALKPEQSRLETTLYLAIIAVFSIAHMIFTAIKKHYFNDSINKVNLVMKAVKSAILVALLFTSALSFNINDFFVELCIILPIMYGIAIHI